MVMWTALLDDVDCDLLLRHRWCRRPDGYVQRSRLGEDKRNHTFYLHRDVMANILGRPLLRGESVDHLDGNPSNNCRSNLRVTTHRLNVTRRTALQTNNTSGYRGVSWDKRSQAWEAYVKFKGVKRHLGFFSTKEEGHAVYVKAASQLFGPENVGCTHA